MIMMMTMMIDKVIATTLIGTILVVFVVFCFSFLFLFFVTPSKWDVFSKR